MFNLKQSNYLEREFSIRAHRQFMPILISPLLLRRIGLGQIDISYFVPRGPKRGVYLVEVKSSLRLSSKQKLRLKKAQSYLATIFNCPVQTALFFPHSKSKKWDMVSF